MSLLDSIGDKKNNDKKVGETSSTDIKNIEQVSIINNSSGIIFESGMSLVEFLRNNKGINEIAEILKYFSKKEIDSAIKGGKVYKKKNKIII